jgi:glycosyltransferase involved in cell wall biosynthesis
LVKEKGVQVLLHAMPLVLKAIPNARLLIAGEGSYRSTLEQLATSLGVQDKVSFLGWLSSEELRTMYRETSLFSMPSLWDEGMGMVFVEAGLMGRPVVASDRGGIRDIIHHGDNGLLVTPGDPVALAEAITTILKDRVLACRMGAAGSRIAREYLAGREKSVIETRTAICRLVSVGPR